MRDLFPEYQEPSDEDIDELWHEGLFTCDANVLLNLYLWEEDNRSDFFRVLRELRDRERLWLPHQVAAEYYRNRPKLIAQAAGKCHALDKDICAFKRSLEKQVEDDRQPIPTGNAIDGIVESLERLSAELQERAQEAKALKGTDFVQSEIEEVFERHMGSPIDRGSLETCYQLLVPPGCEDISYGDRFIWLEMVRRAQDQRTHIVLVAMDAHWQWPQDAEKPRPELVRDMREKAGVRFHAYRPEAFLTQAGERLDLEVREETLDEAARREDEARRLQVVCDLPGLPEGVSVKGDDAVANVDWPPGVPPLTREQMNMAIEAITHMPDPREFAAGIAAVQRVDWRSVVGQLRRLGLIE
jgi:hypothetical protein